MGHKEDVNLGLIFIFQLFTTFFLAKTEILQEKINNGWQLTFHK